MEQQDTGLAGYVNSREPPRYGFYIIAFASAGTREIAWWTPRAFPRRTETRLAFAEKDRGMVIGSARRLARIINPLARRSPVRTGFMSERTAEYVLVPDLISRLQSFTMITPFFHWSSREGQVKAQAGYDGPVRLVAAYARRPKVDAPGDPEVTIKFNALLFHHARQLAKLGIPVLAGVPCVSRLSDLQLGVPCAWFRILVTEAGWPDSEAALRIAAPEHAGKEPDTPVVGPLTSDAITSVIRKHARVSSWPQALRDLSGLKRDRSLSGFASEHWFGPFLRYRPFYLALRE